MDRSTLRSSLARLPLGFVGMMLLVVLVESLLAQHQLDFMGDAAFAWQWGDRSARDRTQKSAILCFGDSVVKFGVAPRIIEGRTGRSTWNLAVTGGRPVNSYLLLQHALDAGARPEAIVVDADLLDSNPIEIPYLWPQLATPREALELAWLDRNPDFLAHYGLALIFPSVQSRFEIRSAILAFTRGEKTNYRSSARLAERNWRKNRGVTIIPETSQLSPLAVTEIDACPADVPIPGWWSSHPVNEIYLDRFLDLTAERGIPVFWLYPPHYRMLDRYLDRPNWTGRQRQVARDRLARYPNLTVIDGLHANYDRPVLIDVAHLNRRGAVAYSTAVGDILRDHLAAHAPDLSRWVELPPFVDPPAETVLEDLNQSSQALARRAAKVIR